MLRRGLWLLAKQKKKASPTKDGAPTVINMIRGYDGVWKKVHQLPDLATFGQEGYKMSGLQIFQGMDDPVIQPRSFYPPEIFELAKVPEDAGAPKAPQRVHKPKKYNFKPKRPTIKR
eukprot:EG_transcript_37478